MTSRDALMRAIGPAGRTQAEVAAALGVSVSAAGKALEKAREAGLVETRLAEKRRVLWVRT